MTAGKKRLKQKGIGKRSTPFSGKKQKRSYATQTLYTIIPIFGSSGEPKEVVSVDKQKPQAIVGFLFLSPFSLFKNGKIFIPLKVPIKRGGEKMAKMVNEWLSSNLYRFEEDEDGNLVIVKNEPHSKIKVTRETLPDNSLTKHLLGKLKSEGCL